MGYYKQKKVLYTSKMASITNKKNYLEIPFKNKSYKYELTKINDQTFWFSHIEDLHYCIKKINKFIVRNYSLNNNFIDQYNHNHRRVLLLLMHS